MNLSGIGGSNSLFNSAVINQKINRTNNIEEDRQGTAALLNDQDSVFISRQGRRNNVISQLMDQRQFIQECKDAEMQRGLESGYMNHEKLDEYDKQLEMLDQKITEALSEEAVQREEDQGTDRYGKKIMTEEEYEKSKVMDMMDLSAGMEQSEAILSVKERLDGEAGVLKAEIKLDKERGYSSERKIKRLAEIEAKSSSLLEQAGEKTADINDKVSEAKEIVREEDDGNENE